MSVTQRSPIVSATAGIRCLNYDASTGDAHIDKNKFADIVMYGAKIHAAKLLSEGIGEFSPLLDVVPACRTCYNICSKDVAPPAWLQPVIQMFREELGTLRNELQHDHNELRGQMNGLQRGSGHLENGDKQSSGQSSRGITQCKDTGENGFPASP